MITLFVVYIICKWIAGSAERRFCKEVVNGEIDWARMTADTQKYGKQYVYRKGNAYYLKRK